MGAGNLERCTSLPGLSPVLALHPRRGRLGSERLFSTESSNSPNRDPRPGQSRPPAETPKAGGCGQPRLTGQQLLGRRKRAQTGLSGVAAATGQRLTAEPGSAAGPVLPELVLIPWGEDTEETKHVPGQSRPIAPTWPPGEVGCCALGARQHRPARRGLGSPAGLMGKPQNDLPRRKALPRSAATEAGAPPRPRGRAQAPAGVGAAGGQGRVRSGSRPGLCSQMPALGP